MSIWSYSENDRIGGVGISHLLEACGTPVYVYDAGTIWERYTSLRRNLPTNADIFYALKANCNLSICAYLRRLGCGADSASQGELILALRAGFKPDRIVYAGPGKGDQELSMAISTGIRAINVESYGEILRINKIAGSLKKKVNINIRVNPNHVIKDALFPMGGTALKLGIDEDLVLEVLSQVKDLPNIRVVGIHAHAGSQVKDYRSLLDNGAKIIDLAVRVFIEAGLSLRMIGLGGGLGIPTREDGRRLDVGRYGRGLKEIIREKSSAYNFDLNSVQLIIEPGRFLVGESGKYLTRIIDIKKSRGKKFLITDGGVNHIFKQKYPEEESEVVVYPTRTVGNETEVVDIGGPLCLSSDIIGRDIHVPEGVKEGDIIIIQNAGAYCFNFSPLCFMCHPTPPEVMIYEEKEYLIRERGKNEDIFFRQRDIRDTFQG